MSRTDGKSNFYRKLNLDKSIMKLLKEYRNIKRSIDRDINIKPKNDTTTN